MYFQMALTNVSIIMAFTKVIQLHLTMFLEICMKINKFNGIKDD